MTPHVPHIGHLQKRARAELLLHAEAVLIHRGVFQVRIDSADAADRRRSWRAAADVGQISVVIFGDLQKRRKIHLREGHVAFRPVVIDAKAAANDGVLIRVIGKPETRRKQAFRIVQAARCARQYLLEERVCGRARHASLLALRNAIARGDQSVVRVARIRNNRPLQRHLNSLRRIVERRHKVRHVVRLCVHRLHVLEAHTHLHAKLGAYLPTVLNEGFRLREAEEAHRVGARFCVALEVTQQGVC